MCRFDFGIKQRYDPSGAMCYTKGKEPVFVSDVVFDKNQQPAFISRRNHPRLVQEPVCVAHWGCNSDLKHLLTSDTLYDQITSAGVSYPKFVLNLIIAKHGGLEPFGAGDTFDHYITSYGCKGNKNSNHWERTLYSIAENYVKDGSPDASFRSVISSFMNEISCCCSVPKDEACFLLGGGHLTLNSMRVAGCSVNSVDLSSIVSGDGDQ